MFIPELPIGEAAQPVRLAVAAGIEIRRHLQGQGPGRHLRYDHWINDKGVQRHLGLQTRPSASLLGPGNE